MELSKELGKTYITRLSHIYSLLWKKKYGINPIISYPSMGKVFSSLIDQMTEIQIAFLLIMFFDWKGANNDDTFVERKLESSAHNIFLFTNELNSMRAYAINRLKIDIGNEDELLIHVNKLIANK